MKEADLVRALEFLTEAPESTVPGALKSAARVQLVRGLEAMQGVARGWLRSSNVQAVGVGRKRTMGQETGELALRVYVATKRARRELEASVPSSLAVPGIGQVPTDVLEIGRLRLQSFRGRARPASPGVGIGHGNVTAGTLGCVVRRRGAADTFILSNSHILADSGRASIGDPVFQPAPADAAPTSQNQLGRLAAFVPFEFSNDGYPNHVDAAIARVAANKARPEVRLIDVRPVALVTEITRGMRVLKVGRTTDLTSATVEDVDLKVAARYMTSSGRRRRAGFSKQVACTPFTADGDSGSAVLTEDGSLVGLHFMGSVGLSVFHPMALVFRALDLELP